MRRLKFQWVGILVAAVVLNGCMTVKKLEEAPVCKVWEDQGILSPRVVEPELAAARYEGSCSVMGMFMCSWLRAELNPKLHEIDVEGNGLFNERRTVATFRNDEIVFEDSILDSIAKSGPVKIDMKKRTASRSVVLTALGLNKSSGQSVSFNDHCTSQQAAVGAVALWLGKSKDH